MTHEMYRSLRKPGDVGYKIPRGGLFTYVGPLFS
jgi:hypothetical protein